MAGPCAGATYRRCTLQSRHWRQVGAYRWAAGGSTPAACVAKEPSPLGVGVLVHVRRGAGGHLAHGISRDGQCTAHCVDDCGGIHAGAQARARCEFFDPRVHVYFATTSTCPESCTCMRVYVRLQHSLAFVSSAAGSAEHCVEPAARLGDERWGVPPPCRWPA